MSRPTRFKRITDSTNVSLDAAAKEADRLPAPGTVTEENHTTFVDNVGHATISSSAGIPLQIGKLDPYHGDDMSDLLNRVYTLPGVSWLATQAFGISVTTISLPDIFLTMPFIYDRLKNYKYFRCTAKVTFRMNTTKYQFGTLMLSWLPYYKKTSSNYAGRHLTVTQQSQNNCVLMSANVNETVTLDIPMVSPKDWWDTQDSPAGQDGDLATVFVTVLNPLTSASPNSPVDVVLTPYVQLTSLEVAGLLPGYLPNPTETRPPKKRYAEDITQHSMPGNTKEANEKGKLGIVTGVKKAMSTVTPIVTDIVSGAEQVYEGGSKIASGLGKAASLLGLDKPSTTQATMPIFFDPDADLQYSSGLDFSRKLTLKPEAQASVSDRIIHGPSNPSLKSVMMKPAWIAQFSFNSTKNPNDILWQQVIHPGLIYKQTSGTKTLISATPMAWFSSMFGKYRGSIKLLFHFNTSSFTTTRVRFTHTQQNVFSNTPLTFQSGDFSSKVVDITGDTIVPVLVPYLDPKSFLSFDWAAATDAPPADNLGNMSVTLVNDVVTPDSTGSSAVYCNVFIAAAEDFEVYQFVGPRNPLTSTWTMNWGNTLPTVSKPTPINQHCSIGQQFLSPFPGVTEATMSKKQGILTEEGGPLILDLAKHYVRYGPLAWTAAAHSVLPTVPNASLLLFYTAPFLFCRGSVRFKFLAKPALAYGVIAPFVQSGTILGPSDVACSGGIWFGSDFGKPIASVEVPYFQAYPFFEVSPTHGATEEPTMTSSVSATDCDFVWHSVGDDFSVGYQAALPLLFYTT